MESKFLRGKWEVLCTYVYIKYDKGPNLQAIHLFLKYIRT